MLFVSIGPAMVAGLQLLPAVEVLLGVQTCAVLHHFTPGLPVQCLQIPIVNPGAAPLSVTADCRGEAFSGPRTFEVPPGMTLGYPLTFSAPWIGEYAGALEMSFAATGGVPPCKMTGHLVCLPATGRFATTGRGKGAAARLAQTPLQESSSCCAGLLEMSPAAIWWGHCLPRGAHPVTGHKAPVPRVP